MVALSESDSMPSTANPGDSIKTRRNPRGQRRGNVSSEAKANSWGQCRTADCARDCCRLRSFHGPDPLRQVRTCTDHWPTQSHHQDERSATDPADRTWTLGNRDNRAWSADSFCRDQRHDGDSGGGVLSWRAAAELSFAHISFKTWWSRESSTSPSIPKNQVA